MQPSRGYGSALNVLRFGLRRILGQRLASAALMHSEHGCGSGVSILGFDRRRILGYALASAALLRPADCLARPAAPERYQFMKPRWRCARS
jgi:hypothetical protein